MAGPFIPPPAPGPATRLFAITPSDSTVFAPTSALWIGSTGDVVVLAANDTVPVLFAAVPSGTLIQVCATKVMATDTTASDIVGMH
jgi:hypothetical protein